MFRSKKVILSLLVFTLLFIVGLASRAALLSQSFSSGDSSFDLWSWIVEHWELVLLVVSEIAALLPSKVSGIIHLLLTLVGKVISKL